MAKFKVNDTVKITAGKDRGQTGTVMAVRSDRDELTVKGKNIYKKHVKAQGRGQPGGIVEKPRPLPFSKVALVCPKCHQPTRVGYQVLKDGKVRQCAKCRQTVDR